MRYRALVVAGLLLAAAAGPALAHHGTASVGGLGVEGPGAALDTTSPLPLGEGTAFVLLKCERASFQQRGGFADQKSYSSFNTLALGYGLQPWLSVFLLQPYNWKAQHGVGTNSGLGDPNLVLGGSFKWDEGLRLAPRKESLDELADWHFGLRVSLSLPLGPTTHRDDQGAYYPPDMQTGFRGVSPGVGLSALKQVGDDLTIQAELGYQHFFVQRYRQAGYRYQFGAETRLDGALVWRAWSGTRGRVDLAAELSALDLQRDRTDAAGGVLEPMRASGGTVLYGLIGARVTSGVLSLGVSVKRPMARRLHEAPEQQGSEGLESFRAAVSLGYAARF